MKLKRNALNGAVLRPFGLTYSGIERSGSGLKLIGGDQKLIDFSELSAALSVEKVLGFAAIFLPIKGGDKLKIAGIKAGDAKRFVTAANDSFFQHVAEKFEANEQEAFALCEAIDRLSRPRRYPSACLLEPFVQRAQKLAEILPSVVPQGALSDKQQELHTKILDFATDPRSARDAAIKTFIANETDAMGEFFDTIESNPLTPEQRRAVVTDEDATLVLAGAGSGKTSVIVAKAAYLVAKAIREPKDILLMAFGKEAAAEMAERIKERSGVAVDALTFHALGNRIIRDVEGRGPALAAHASDEAKYRALLRDILITEVAQKAGLGRVLLKWFSEFYWPYKSEWDFKSKSQYYQWVESHDLRTLNGDRVKSYEEWEISNWLYRNGIAYEYEPVYEHELPSNARSAYNPDFRLTESGIYIEHFGVRKSRAPDGSTQFTTAPYINREKYLEEMEWKRQVHRDNGTVLIETYSYEKVEGRLLDALKEKLEPHIALKPVPDDQLFNTLSAMGQIDAFTQTLGTFLRHFKSSGATIDGCLAKGKKGEEAPRNRAFLRVFEPLLSAYQERLGEQIDFEDMINRATEHIETGRFQSPYRHLLVDEFQDISEGRARLLRALKAQHSDARIFAVGDDWQSIFRFAGSDIHLMRDFGQEFGGKLGSESGVYSTIDLGRTFRSVDKIALPARRFVLQNPSQIEKQVITASSADHPAIRVAYYENSQDSTLISSVLSELSAGSRSEISVLLLGRYNFLRPKNLRAVAAAHPKVSLRFMTAHGSKGLEADHVIILRAASDTMGFPSEIADDPLLDLVLPKPENFDHAEERRLFYVALTRARKSVTILADRSKPSVFVRELIDHPAYETIEIGDPGVAEIQCPSCSGRMLTKTGKNGRTYFSCEHRPLCNEMLRPCSACGKGVPVADKAHPSLKVCDCGAEFPSCPECDEGWLVERKGRYGKFLGCIRYPECSGKQKL
jgi:DNA helicase-4